MHDFIIQVEVFSSFNLHFQTDHDPRNPAYVTTQGPLPHTVADFWQVSPYTQVYFYIFPFLFILKAIKKYSFREFEVACDKINTILKARWKGGGVTRDNTVSSLCFISLN